MKYQMGSYLVVLFTEIGSKLKTIRGFSTLDEAVEAGRREKPDGGSYAVLRVLVNSCQRYRANEAEGECHG